MKRLFLFLKSLFNRPSTKPITPSSEAPLWYQIACKEVGQKEKRGGENPRIIEYHSATTLRALEDEVAWCASFVCWCLEKAGVKSTKSAAARSYLSWGRKIKEPTEGCIVVFERGKGWQGHVGFVAKTDKDNVWCLGGNQGDQVSIAKYPKKKVLGYMVP